MHFTMSAAVAVAMPYQFAEAQVTGIPNTSTIQSGTDIRGFISPLARYPDLSGHWRDAGGSPQRFILKHFADYNSPVVLPNTTYAVQCSEACWWNVGFCSLETLWKPGASLSPSFAMHLRCELDFGGQIFGSLRTANEIIWEKSEFHEAWLRVGGINERLDVQQNIYTAHVVFASYYNVAVTDYINHVDNVYMHQYFPLAETVAESVRQRSDNQSFAFMIYPWLMYRFLHCPCPELRQPCLARTLGNIAAAPLRCPTQLDLETFSASARRGDLSWNAAPLDLQVEGMSPDLFEAGLRLLELMDDDFYGERRTHTMFSRGVSYLTRGVIPLLHKHGISGLVIASGLASASGVSAAFPKVPQMHRWVDPNSGSDIVVVYQPFGDAGNPFPDCAESPNGFALCVEFGEANAGPPTSATTVENTMEKVRDAYPRAQVKASTFDGFMESVAQIKNVLPRIDLEVGDAAICGSASDPLKVAQSRAIQRIWGECLRRLDGRCMFEDPAIANMTFFLLKLHEGSWGSSSIEGCCSDSDYNATFFQRRLTASVFMKAAASWAERRFFVELAVRALSESGHPLAAPIRRAVDDLADVTAPSLNASGYRKLTNITDVVMLKNQHGDAAVQFRADGAIVGLRQGGVDWASTRSPLAAYVYRTFVGSRAHCGGEHESRNRCAVGAWSEDQLWRPMLDALWLHHSAHSVVAVLSMPPRSHTSHGAPRELYLNVSLPTLRQGMTLSDTPGEAHMVELTLTWIGKQPTIGGEASVLTFQPAPRLLPTHVASWHEKKAGTAFGMTEQRIPAAEASAWRFDKVGSSVDPEGVIDGGSQFCHGVWDGAAARTEAGIFRIETLDTATISPMEPDCPEGCPFPISEFNASSATDSHRRLPPGSVVGAAVNLHNNLWSNSYPVFYPYFDPRLCTDPNTCADSNLQFRFRLHLGESQQWVSSAKASGRSKRKDRSLDPLTLSAVIFVGGAAVLLGLRALHYENSGELLLEDLQDLEPDDNGFLMFSNRGFSHNHRLPSRGSGLGGLGTVADLRLGGLSLSERYPHIS